MTSVKSKTTAINKSALLRFYIIRERQAQHISSSELARRAFLHKSVISEIETGKVNATQNAKESILKALNSQYIEDDSYFMDAQKQTITLFESIANRNLRMIDYVFEKFEQRKDKLLHSSAYPYYLQSQMATNLHRSVQGEESENLLEEMGSLVPYMEPAFGIRYYDMLLIYVTRYCNLSRLTQVIHKAENYAYRFHIDTDADAYQFSLLAIHMARACYRAQYFDLCIQFIQKAKELLVSLNSFIRIPTCNLLEANVYHQQGNIKNASKIYLILIHNISGNADEATINEAAEKYAWCKLLGHNYKDTIHTEEKVEKHHNVTSLNIAIIPYCYWKQQEFDKALALIEKQVKNESIPLEYRTYLKAIGCLCRPVNEEDHAYFMKVAPEMLANVIEKGDFLIHMFTLFIISKGCAYYSESKQQSFYLKQAYANLKRDIFCSELNKLDSTFELILV